ncbi:MAG: hypothetical protein R3E12_11300 [Candidatus Eisenbacteria bacterium]
MMKRTVMTLALVMVCGPASGAVLFEQPPRPEGGYFHSAWWDPDGSNYDEYVWDRFVLTTAADIDSIRWRGAYDPAHGGGPFVVDFTVAIYAASVGGSQPDVSHPPLVEYQVGGTAGETYVGDFGGESMYDYRFALPVPFHAEANVPYWVQIEGWQNGFPSWSLAAGSGADNYHFRCQHTTASRDGGPPTGCYFTNVTGDVAFALLTSAVTRCEESGAGIGIDSVGSAAKPRRRAIAWRSRSSWSTQAPRRSS